MEQETSKTTKKNRKFTKGGQNLILLGLAATLIAVSTTGVSLAVYHNSGDIYLDRSRPGYLPDQTEIESDDTEGEYEFSKTGMINTEVLDEYLKNLNEEVEGIDAYGSPFDAGALSDESLGIMTEEPEALEP